MTENDDWSALIADLERSAEWYEGRAKSGFYTHTIEMFAKADATRKAIERVRRHSDQRQLCDE